VAHFTALVSVPETNLVKVLYGVGIGTAAIGQVSQIADKIVALFGEGGVTLGPSQAIVLNATLRDKREVKSPTDAVTAGNIGVYCVLSLAVCQNIEK